MSDRITIPLYRVGWSSEAPLLDDGPGHLLACKNYVIKQNLVESRKGYFPVLAFEHPVKTLISLPEYNILIVCSDDTIYVYQETGGTMTEIANKSGYSTSEWRWAYINHQIIMVNGQDNAQQISVTDPFEPAQAVTIADWAVTGAPSLVFDWVATLNAQVCAGYGNAPLIYSRSSLADSSRDYDSDTVFIHAPDACTGYAYFPVDIYELLNQYLSVGIARLNQTGYPLGKTPFINWSGDLIIMTNKGFISAHSIFANGENQNAQYIFSQRINTWLLEQATNFSGEHGFMGVVVPSEDFVLFNIPQGGGEFVQVCMNITSGKWSLFNSINAYTMCVFDGRLLFGMADGVFQYGDSLLDNNFIPLEIWTSYSDCGNDNLKRINMFQLRHSSSDKINIAFAVYKDFENQAYYNWTDTSGVIESIADSGFIWSNYALPDDPTPGTAYWDTEYWAGGYGAMTPSADTYSASGLGHNFSIRMTANVKGIKHQVVDLMLLFNTSRTAI